MIKGNNKSFIRLYEEFQDAILFDKNDSINFDTASLFNVPYDIPEEYGRFNKLYNIVDEKEMSDLLNKYIRNAYIDILFFFREMVKIPSIITSDDYSFHDIVNTICKRRGEFVEPNFTISKETYEKIIFTDKKLNPIVNKNSENFLLGLLLVFYYHFIKKYIVIINYPTEVAKDTFETYMKKIISVNELIVSTDIDIDKFLKYSGVGYDKKIDTRGNDIPGVFIFNMVNNELSLTQSLIYEDNLKDKYPYDIKSYTVVKELNTIINNSSEKPYYFLREDFITENKNNLSYDKISKYKTDMHKYIIDKLVYILRNNDSLNTHNFLKIMLDITNHNITAKPHICITH